MKKWFLTTAAIFCAVVSFAQKVSFEVSVPRVVSVGEVFRLEYVLNAKPENFSAGEFDSSQAQVLAGPSTSQGQEISINNGGVTRKVTYTVTYVLQGDTPGKLTIPVATATIDGKQYATSPITVEIVASEGGAQPGAAVPQGGNDDPPTASTQSTTIGADDILVRVTVNRNTVFKGQPVKASVKLYSRLGLSGIESAKYPAFNGFWTQDLDVEGYKWQRETYNGKVYDARVIREYLLYPQQSGTLHIERLDLTVIAQIVSQNRRQSLFDDFFSGGPNVQEIKRKVSSAPVEIRVKELPAGAPADFSGAVGQFSMSSSMSATDIAANSSATYTLKITGSGNLPLISAPRIELPASVEQYNVKTLESLKPTSSDITGYRQFEYPFIPRAQGEIILEPVKFTYFDPERAKYVTLSSEEYKLNILPDSAIDTTGGRGLVSGISREDIKILDKDIHFIKLGSAALRTQERFLFGTPLYFGLMALLAALAGALYAYLRRVMKENGNIVMVRNKRANRVALQRLRSAARYLKADDSRGFYDEMLKALWGYMGDKLNIPVADLTKDNVLRKLIRRDIAPEEAQRFIDMVSQCEMAQYSPASSGAMGELYNDALAMLARFEPELGRKKKKKA